MHDTENSTTPAAKRVPWNKGKLTGAPPRPKHVWAIRTNLQMDQGHASRRSYRQRKAPMAAHSRETDTFTQNKLLNLYPPLH